MLETENVELQDLYVISGELGMVDEAQKALEEAEALKKVCVFFRNFFFCLTLIYFHLIECGDVFEFYWHRDHSVV